MLMSSFFQVTRNFGPCFVIHYLVSFLVLQSYFAEDERAGCFTLFEPQHEISNNVVCATSIASDQPAHTRSLIRAFASR